MNLCRFIIASPPRAAKSLVTALNGNVKNRPHPRLARKPRQPHVDRTIHGYARRTGSVVTFLKSLDEKTEFIYNLIEANSVAMLPVVSFHGDRHHGTGEIFSTPSNKPERMAPIKNNGSTLKNPTRTADCSSPSKTARNGLKPDVLPPRRHHFSRKIHQKGRSQ